MDKNKTIVLIFTLLLVLLAALGEFGRERWQEFPVSAVLSCDGGEEPLKFHFQSENTCYLFLPGFADTSRLRLTGKAFSHAALGGRSLTPGITCGELPLEQPLSLTYRQEGRQKEMNLILMRSENTAALYLDVSSGSMDHIHKKKGNSEAGALRLYTREGALDCSANIEALSGRGNSTWDRPKKPYNLTLTAPQDLLGMGSAKKWILLSNFDDFSNICNKMVLDFARQTGAAYTPECRMVDLYLNGDYAGLYLLCERNELDPQRIAVDPDQSFLISLSVDWQLDKSRPYFQSDRELLFRIHQRGVSIDKIFQIWQSVENALYAEDGIDPVTGKSWLELIDLDSWAQQFLLDEVFVEFDAFALSQFFYYDPESGRLCGGPQWDNDNILDRCGKHPANIIAAGRPYVWSEADRSLGGALWEKPEFQARVKQLYREQYREKLLELAQGGIQAETARYLQAGIMDTIRWSGPGLCEEDVRMSRYLSQRIAFLDDYWFSDASEFCYLDVGADQQWRRFALRKGDTAQCLQEYTDNFGAVRWIYCKDESPFDITRPVYEDTMLWMIWPQS